MGEAVVSFQNVGKRFRCGESHDSLRDLVSLGLLRLIGKAPRADSSTFWGLRGVSFTVGRGEAVGIIGANGAGKSTALKLISGILRADEGRVEVKGRLAALIEVGAGFHGDLTGRENVFLSGSILGMTRGEVRRKLDAIVAFAGLEGFLDMPVKRYSSGMYARLGFSIAAHVDPHVLLVDEVLSVGDAVFRLRCLDRMRRLVAGGTTLIFVTHDLDQMQSICPRAIVLDHGRVAFDGDARESVSCYMRSLSELGAARSGDVTEAKGHNSPTIDRVDLRVLDGHGRASAWVRADDELRLAIGFRANRAVPRLVVEANLRAGVGTNLISLNSARSERYFAVNPGPNEIMIALPCLPLCGGAYDWSVRMWDADTGLTLVDTPYRFPLMVNDGGRATGAFCLEHLWIFRELAAESAPVPSVAFDEPAPLETAGVRA